MSRDESKSKHNEWIRHGIIMLFSDSYVEPRALNPFLIFATQPLQQLKPPEATHDRIARVPVLGVYIVLYTPAMAMAYALSGLRSAGCRLDCIISVIRALSRSFGGWVGALSKPCTAV